MTINSIQARLGSIGPLARERCPMSVQRILNEDMPILLEIADYAAAFVSERPECVLGYNVGMLLNDALKKLDSHRNPPSGTA